MTTDMYVKYTETISLSQFGEQVKGVRAEQLFHPDEIQLYGNENKPRSLAARWLIKQILIENFGGDLSHTDICITSQENGKPFLKINKEKIRNTIHFSISHSRNYISVLVLIEQ